ncbi:MAG: ABC transporter permease, partial [Terriglobales bacterium]
AESIVLAVAGGAAGLGLAAALMAWVAAKAPAAVPNLSAMHLDWRVLGYALTLAVASVVMFGLLPSWHATAIHRQGIGTQRALLTVELALALAVLVSSGLLLRSLAAVRNVNPGFDPRGLLAVPVSTDCSGDACLAWTRSLLQHAQALPGVKAAAFVMQPPLEGFMWISHYYAVGASVPENTQPWTEMNFVTPGYFSVLGANLLSGREFADSDSAGGAKVAIVNRNLARKVWPRGRGVGNQLHLQGQWRTVVGVVQDLKQTALDQPVGPAAFLPYAQMPVQWGNLMLRTSGGGGATAAELRQSVGGAGSPTTVKAAEDMSALVDRTTAPRRFETDLLAGFGGLALMLAATGVYGVSAFAAAQRRCEFAIRAALGAQRRQLIELALRSSLAWIGMGVLAGLALGLVGGSLLRGLLFGVSRWDAVSFTGAALLLALLALLAAWLPAYRAARQDPAAELRR